MAVRRDPAKSVLRWFHWLLSVAAVAAAVSAAVLLSIGYQREEQDLQRRYLLGFGWLGAAYAGMLVTAVVLVAWARRRTT